jgi:hypothetical protein
VRKEDKIAKGFNKAFSQYCILLCSPASRTLKNKIATKSVEVVRVLEKT